MALVEAVMRMTRLPSHPIYLEVGTRALKPLVGEEVDVLQVLLLRRTWKTDRSGEARLRQVDMDGLKAGRAVALTFVELEVDGVVKKDRGEGGAGIFFCDNIVWVWVLKGSDKFLPVLRVLRVRSLSFSEDVIWWRLKTPWYGSAM